MESNSTKVSTPKSIYEPDGEQNVSDMQAKFDSLKLKEKTKIVEKRSKNKVSKKSEKKECIAIKSSQRLQDCDIPKVSALDFGCAFQCIFRIAH